MPKDTVGPFPDSPLLSVRQREEIRHHLDEDTASQTVLENYLRWLLDHADATHKLIENAHMALAVTKSDECNEDTCWEHCFAGSVHDDLFAAIRCDLTDEERADLKAASEHRPPHTPPGMESANA